MKIWNIALLIAWLGLGVACTAAPPPTPTPIPPIAPILNAQASPVATATATPTQVVAPTATPEPTPTPTSIPALKIGVLLDKTGGLADYAAMIENGFNLGLDYATSGKREIVGKPVQIILRDTESKPDNAAQFARELLDKEKVEILIAPQTASAALAVSDVAKQAQRVVIHTTSHPDPTGRTFNPYAFRAARTNVQDALALANMLSRKSKTFVQIAPAGPLGTVSAAWFYYAVKNNGGQFAINDNVNQLGAVLIPADAKDWLPYVQRAIKAQPEVLIVTWIGPGFASLFNQMQSQGVMKTLTVGTLFPDNRAIQAGYKPLVGVLGITNYHYTLPKNAANDWLVEKHKAQFKTPPDIFTETGFVAAQMLVAGLKATNGDTSGDKLSAALEKLSFDGPKGKYTVRDFDHVLLQPLFAVKLNNTDHPDFKFFESLGEVRPEDSAPLCLLESEFKSRCPVK